MKRLVQVLIFIAVLNISGSCLSQSDFIIAGDSEGMFITTVDPPFWLCCSDLQFYYIDIDNDNIDDFELKSEDEGSPSYNFREIEIKGLGTYKVAYDTTLSTEGDGPRDMAKGVMQGDTINNSLTFLPGALTIFTRGFSPNIEGWLYKMDGGPYIPIILNDGDVHTYGWIEIEIWYSNIYIYSYSIESTTSLKEFKSSSFKLYPNPAKDLITISVNETVQVKKVRVYSVTGQIISEKEMPENNLQLEVSDLQSGMYLLEVETEDGFREVKRLIIED